MRKALVALIGSFAVTACEIATKSVEDNCGTVPEKQLVLKVARENKALQSDLRDAFIKAQNLPESDQRYLEQKRVYDSAVDHANKLLEECSHIESDPFSSSRQTKEDCLAERQSDTIDEEQSRAWRKLSDLSDELSDNAWSVELQKIKYDLVHIILKSRNPDTNAPSCVGELTAEIDGLGRSSKEISYTVERTTDGDLVVTIADLPS